MKPASTEKATLAAASETGRGGSTCCGGMSCRRLVGWLAPLRSWDKGVGRWAEAAPGAGHRTRLAGCPADRAGRPKRWRDHLLDAGIGRRKGQATGVELPNGPQASRSPGRMRGARATRRSAARPFLVQFARSARTVPVRGCWGLPRVAASVGLRCRLWPSSAGDRRRCRRVAGLGRACEHGRRFRDGGREQVGTTMGAFTRSGGVGRLPPADTSAPAGSRTLTSQPEDRPR